MALKLKNVWFRYRRGDPPILRDIDVEFGRGVTALIGPNGAGKSTLLKVAAAIYKPERGDVYIDGIDVWNLSNEQRVRLRRDIIYIHEHPVMLRRSVWDNIAYGLRIRGITGEKLEERVKEALKTMDIEELGDAWAPALSAGQRQRVALARALAVNPRYLLLDEPTSNLDSRSRKFLEDVIRMLAAQGVTIVAATHDRLAALRLSARAILMENGEIIAEGSPHEIIEL